MSAKGITATVIATELFQALQTDSAAGKGLTAGGKFGPAASGYIRELAAAYVDSGNATGPGSAAPAIAAIAFAIEASEGLAFMRAWMHGEWDVIRREWPEAPCSVFVTV